MNTAMSTKAVKTSAWFLYTMIVLEILFMVSPFAAYYYSVYATPLNALQESAATAWLTMYVLPHFTYSDSWLANGLVLISWPLILTGLVLFIFGFIQIYWAKFTRRGAVVGGLYRHIRHPQYVALAIIGLGCALYWSRFIVILAFVSMLCLYYLLARIEEQICLEKFGDSYRDYLDRTGMFLPRRWEAHWAVLDWRLPESRWRRATTLCLAYLVVAGVTMGGSMLLRNHVIESLVTDSEESRVTVFLAPVDADTRAAVRELLGEANVPGDIAYVAPASWSVPELGLKRSADAQTASGLSELVHPTTHGNPLSTDQTRLNVVTAEAAYAVAGATGRSRLNRALNLRPLMVIELDVSAQAVASRRNADDSQWSGIPVPTF
jgi:protein-S-isoprenylcysteine O-methyltransferase Ste14